MFVKNCWYIAAWDYEVPGNSPVSRTIINEPIVLYRDSKGEVVALQDRCCHRAAPLSLGSVEGDALRCMYHGLKFAPNGKCVEIPGQATIPAKACVRSFPVVEQHSWIWVWMGDPALADPSLIPMSAKLDDPKWIFRSGQIDYLAHYQYINDNLLDFSHLSYVHPNSFGSSLDWAHTRPKVTRLERAVRVERWVVNQPAPPTVGEITGDTVDMWNAYTFYVPGVMIMQNGIYPGGTAERLEDQAPTEQPLFQSLTCQGVTPITETTSRYFFSWGPDSNRGNDELADAMINIAKMAFEEDRVMIEAQQRVLNQMPDADMVPTSSDQALGQFRWIIDRLIKLESVQEA
ncbi:Toluene-4-sulfonate monooxygenase system iron-sulfur subunit TsaM1 [compost metagenome]